MTVYSAVMSGFNPFRKNLDGESVGPFRACPPFQVVVQTRHFQYDIYMESTRLLTRRRSRWFDNCNFIHSETDESCAIGSI